MFWNPKNRASNNELGEYLPDDNAQLQEGSEYLEASSQPEAVEKCKEIAAEYGATESEVEQLQTEKDWNCKFWFWS